jgi:hypothetical protein
VNEKRSEIDGVMVETRIPAKLLVPSRSEPHPHTTIDEVLLVNGEVLFECVHPNRGDCTFTATSAVSVRAHQKAHGPMAEARRLQRELAAAEAERAQATAELEERIKRRSNGSRKGAETRRRKRGDVDQNNDEGKINGTGGDNGVVRQIQLTLSALTVDVAHTSTVLERIIEQLRAVHAQLDGVSIADNDLRDKAAAWDQLRGLMSRNDR